MRARCRAARCAQTAPSQTFRVFVRGADTGIEEVTVLESADGWTLRGSGKLRAPVNLAMDYWEARYDRAWKPIELTINLTESAKKWTVHTTSTARSRRATSRRKVRFSAGRAPSPPTPLCCRTSSSARTRRWRRGSPPRKVGSQLQVFIAPQDALPATIHNVTDETIKVPARSIAARRWTLHMGGGSAKLEMEVWTEGSRLLRLDIPTQMLTVLRDDIASVSARLVTMARPNDEEVSIPANGFSLAATISKTRRCGPAGSRRPGESPRRCGCRPSCWCRDPARPTATSSSPAFRSSPQLANAFADAGYLVVRYDERGAGQSGGRQESATIDEFAVDARAVVAYLLKRRDVDPKRISLIGYGEGGWIALLVAAREQKIAAVGLIATPSTPGTELVLEQQRLLFERGGTSPAAAAGGDRAAEKNSRSRRHRQRLGELQRPMCASGSTRRCIGAF